MGCGHVARRFATSLRAAGGLLRAVASRTPGKAPHFAERYGAEKSHADYAALAADPSVDAVYVATTHDLHHANARLALEAGKAVLCEKPLTIDARSARDLFETARRNDVFLMEAMWMRFLPAIRHLLEALNEGLVGEPRALRADFSIDGRALPPQHRLRNPALAGGALLDLGIYPIAFARLVFGADPERIQATAELDATGVDARSAYLLEYPGARHARLSASYLHLAPTEAVVSGTEGFVHVPCFLAAEELRIHRPGSDEPEIRRFPFDPETGFRFEIEEAETRIRQGSIESHLYPAAATIGVLETMDAVRRQIFAGP